MRTQLASPITIIKDTYALLSSKEVFGQYALFGGIQVLYTALMTYYPEALFSIIALFPSSDTGLSVVGLFAFFIVLLMFAGVMLYYTAVLYFWGYNQLEKGGVQRVTDYTRQGWRRLTRFTLVVLVCFSLGFVGFLALIIPGIIISVLLFFAPMIALFEPGGKELSKSRALVRGKFWAVLGRIVFFMFTYFIIQLVLRSIWVPLYVLWSFASPALSLMYIYMYRNLNILSSPKK